MLLPKVPPLEEPLGYTAPELETAQCSYFEYVSFLDSFNRKRQSNRKHLDSHCWSQEGKVLTGKQPANTPKLQLSLHLPVLGSTQKRLCSGWHCGEGALQPICSRKQANYKGHLKGDKGHPVTRHESPESCRTDIEVIHCVSQALNALFVLGESDERDFAVGERGQQLPANELITPFTAVQTQEQGQRSKELRLKMHFHTGR